MNESINQSINPPQYRVNILNQDFFLQYPIPCTNVVTWMNERMNQPINQSINQSVCLNRGVRPWNKPQVSPYK